MIHRFLYTWWSTWSLFHAYYLVFAIWEICVNYYSEHNIIPACLLFAITMQGRAWWELLLCETGRSLESSVEICLHSIMASMHGCRAVHHVWASLYFFLALVQWWYIAETIFNLTCIFQTIIWCLTWTIMRIAVQNIAKCNPTLILIHISLFHLRYKGSIES